MASNLVEFAQDLKRQVPIDQLISDYLPSVQRHGRTIKALCPFHEEKTPSFHINPEFGFYHCFGCNAHGDVIKFVQEFEKVDFRLAVETVAGRFGIAIPEFRGGATPEQRDRAAERRKLLLEICNFTERYFRHQLWNHPEADAAREYLTGRGLTEAQMKDYRLGFAPEGYEGLLRETRKKGYKDEMVVLAGLAVAKDRGGRSTASAIG
jgi:DNA primase